MVPAVKFREWWDSLYSGISGKRQFHLVSAFRSRPFWAHGSPSLADRGLNAARPILSLEAPIPLVSSRVDLPGHRGGSRGFTLGLAQVSLL